MVFRTPAIEEGLGLNLGQRAREIVDRTPRDLLNRAAAFLILKDSRSSFEIEGERVSTDRVRRWGQVIGEAGGTPLGIEEFVRLQKLLLGDTKLVPIGLRKDGVFVGEHDRFDRTPIPDHIGARPEDLLDLMGGLVAFDQGFAQLLDPVVAAAVLAFGFVYIHPLADGNGRLHRYLIHHTLARQGFNPPGIVFPISSVILDRIAGYRIALEDYSKRLLRCIEWNPTGEGNLEVLNDTSDFYRYFDATPHVEFLFSCVRRAVEHDLPAETNFLRRYDALRSGVENLVEMPKSTFNLLFKFLEQNEGRLSKRALEQEFAALSKDEVTEIEAMYREIFEIEEDARPRFDP